VPQPADRHFRKTLKLEQQIGQRVGLGGALCARDWKRKRGITPAAGHSETKAMPQGKAASEKKVRVDRFAEARRAKKKTKRMRRRAKLKQSHTKG